MRMPLLNALRQMRLQISSLLGLIVIIGVAVGFYATLKSNSVNFEQSSHQYFRDYKMPDLIVDGIDFAEEDAANLEKIAGVEAVQARATVDARDGDITFRLLSYDIHNPRVNRPYLYDGEEPKTAEECLVADKYALKHNVHPGDTLSFENRAFSAECKVAGIATTPEDMYLKQSATESIADTSEFGVLYVDTEFLLQRKIPMNQIALVFAQDSDEERIYDTVEDKLGGKILKLTKREMVSSYDAFSADVGDFSRMAYIFPIVFLIIASVVVFVGQRRNVLRDRRQIGVLKAMGSGSAQIMFLYCAISVVATVVGAALGAVIARVAGPSLVNTYQSIFSAPFFTFEGLAHHIWLPTILAFIVTIVSTVIAVWGVVTIMPAEAMHAEQPKTGRDILLQRTRLWNRLTFHSRYAVKSALRNRGRFFAMVCGVVASVTLTVMSLGFQDSYKFITTDYFDTAIDYDFAVRTQPTPSTQPPAFLDAVDLTQQQQALVLPATLTAGDRDEELPVVIVDDPEAVYSFKSDDGGEPKYGDGLVLSHYYADKLGVSVGDAVEITTPNGVVEGTIKVSDRVRQNLGFIAIANYAQAEKHLGLESPSYNTIFANTDGDRHEIEKEIERQEGVLAISSIGDERESFQKLSATLNMYIELLVMFSIVLGVAALYSVSTIALLARQYEFVILRVMGYSPREISLAYLKELVMQFLVGLPLGLVGGYYLTSFVARQFANSQMLFASFINWDTYVYSALAAALVIGFVWLVSLRKIARLQLVEGLKGRDE